MKMPICFYIFIAFHMQNVNIKKVDKKKKYQAKNKNNIAYMNRITWLGKLNETDHII